MWSLRLRILRAFSFVGVALAGWLAIVYGIPLMPGITLKFYTLLLLILCWQIALIALAASLIKGHILSVIIFLPMSFVIGAASGLSVIGEFGIILGMVTGPLIGCCVFWYRWNKQAKKWKQASGTA